MTGDQATPAASSQPGTSTGPPARGYSAPKDPHLARLTRIVDEVRRSQHMMVNDDARLDIVGQISFIQAALDELAVGLLADHAHMCVIETGPRDRADRFDEVLGAIGRLVRRDRDARGNNPEAMRGQVR